MSAASDPLRIAIVPGVIIGKWTTAWRERRVEPLTVLPIEEADQRSVLIEGQADICFVRLPVDREGLSIIRLYSEVPMVVAPRDHLIADCDAVSLADLAGEIVRQEVVADAIDLVVAGVGIVLLPQSIARQYARKDLVARPITDAPETEIAVAWLAEETTPAIEEFIGIVRGRKASSSRGPAREPEATPASTASRPPKPAQSAKSGTRKPGNRPKPASRAKKPRGRH